MEKLVLTYFWRRRGPTRHIHKTRHDARSTVNDEWWPTSKALGEKIPKIVLWQRERGVRQQTEARVGG